VPLAVTLRAGEGDAGALLALQDEAAPFAAGPSMRELGYWPHVTLAIYEDVVPQELREIAAQLFDGAAAIELAFEAVRWFEGPNMTLYAAPAPSRALEELAGKLHRLIAPERCHPHYRPGCYTPHCTLAMMISPDAREDAIAFARRKRIRFRAAFMDGEVVSFPPPRVEARWRLPATGRATRR
jgi:2'-5' RNA ligase